MEAIRRVAEEEIKEKGEERHGRKRMNASREL
jgi:hypothetical protein